MGDEGIGGWKHRALVAERRAAGAELACDRAVARAEAAEARIKVLEDILESRLPVVELQFVHVREVLISQREEIRELKSLVDKRK